MWHGMFHTIDEEKDWHSTFDPCTEEELMWLDRVAQLLGIGETSSYRSNMPIDCPVTGTVISAIDNCFDLAQDRLGFKNSCPYAKRGLYERNTKDLIGVVCSYKGRTCEDNARGN